MYFPPISILVLQATFEHPYNMILVKLYETIITLVTK